MSVASNQNNVLNMFYGEIPVKKSLPRPLKPLVEIEEEPTIILLISGFVFGKWLYLKKTLTEKIFLSFQKQ